MFCRNCGKEVSNDTRFCNYCGAPQYVESTQNTEAEQKVNPAQNTGTVQGMNQQTNPPKKPKKNIVRRIIISVAVAAAAFGIGYFATGAFKLKRPTAFNVPSEIKLDDIESPSIKADTEENMTDVYTEGSKVLAQHVYSVDTDIVKSKVFFNYKEDGTVISVSGSISYYDTSLVDIINDLKNDVKYAKEFLKEMGAPQASDVSIREEDNFVNVIFSFSELADNSNMAELAAAFIGFEAENGKITIDIVDEAMPGFGYTLE